MASAQQYSGRRSMLSKPTRDLAYGHIYRYIKNPSDHNPRNLGQKMHDQAQFYKLDKDLDSSLYELPE